MELSSCVVLLIACLSIAEGVSQTLATAIARAQERNQQQPEHVSPCNAFVRMANHSDSKYVIGDYLSVVLEGPLCNASVSQELIAIFTDSEKAWERREDLKESLSNLCSAFIDAISITANDLTYGICYDDRDLLSTESLNQEFCGRPELETEKEDRQLEECLKGMKLTSISTEVGNLVEISDSRAGCTAKCGEGDGRILCNAFYLLTRWLNPHYQEVYGKSEESSDVDTHMDTESTAEQTNTDSLTNPKPPVPAPSTPSFDDAALVSKLLPFLSLPLQYLHLLARQNSATLTDPESTLSFLPDTLPLEDFKKLKHAQTTLRVFYLAKVMYNQLYVMSERSLKYYVSHTEAFTFLTGFPTETAKLDFGDDLSMVLAAMVNYRDILFTPAARELVEGGQETPGSVQGGNAGGEEPETPPTKTPKAPPAVSDEPPVYDNKETTSTLNNAADEMVTTETVSNQPGPGAQPDYGIGTLELEPPSAKSDESSANVNSDNKSLLENMDLRGFLLAMGLKDDDFAVDMHLADSKSEDEALEIIGEYCKKFSSVFHREDVTPEAVYELIKYDWIVREGLGLEDTEEVMPDISLDLGWGGGGAVEELAPGDDGDDGVDADDYYQYELHTTTGWWSHYQHQYYHDAGPPVGLILLAVAGGLLLVFLLSVCVLTLTCCCVNKWDKVREAAGCQRRVKYYRLSSTEDI